MRRRQLSVPRLLRFTLGSVQDGMVIITAIIVVTTVAIMADGGITAEAGLGSRVNC